MKSIDESQFIEQLKVTHKLDQIAELENEDKQIQQFIKLTQEVPSADDPNH